MSIDKRQRSLDLLWFMPEREKANLSFHVRKALESWKTKKDLQCLKPEYLILSSRQEWDLPEVVEGLTVKYEYNVSPFYFKIRGG